MVTRRDLGRPSQPNSWRHYARHTTRVPSPRDMSANSSLKTLGSTCVWSRSGFRTVAPRTSGWERRRSNRVPLAPPHPHRETRGGAWRTSTQQALAWVTIQMRMLLPVATTWWHKVGTSDFLLLPPSALELSYLTQCLISDSYSWPFWFVLHTCSAA